MAPCEWAGAVLTCARGHASHGCHPRHTIARAELWRPPASSAHPCMSGSCMALCAAIACQGTGGGLWPPQGAGRARTVEAREGSTRPVGVSDHWAVGVLPLLQACTMGVVATGACSGLSRAFALRGTTGPVGVRGKGGHSLDGAVVGRCRLPLAPPKVVHSRRPAPCTLAHRSSTIVSAQG